MSVEDSGVALGHWEPEPRIGAIAEVRGSVDAFAAEHGMPRQRREDVRAAVAEAVADAVVRLRRSEAPGRLVVDAATDGAWLSVQVKDDAVDRSHGQDGALPLVQCLPHRLEWDADDRGTHLLMEFPMTAAMQPRDEAPRAPGRRRRRGVPPLVRRRR
jgi:Histidine kinase-like ATPase domain